MKKGIKIRNNELDVVFIIDKSGSMQGTESDTIGGYNKYLTDNQKDGVYITTAMFDESYKLLTFRKEAKDTRKLTNKDYIPSGCTALYDAIGKTITKLDKENVTNKVLFIITTDGLENASTDYNKKDIIQLIKSHKNYEFIYLGANIDSYSEGAKLGIDRSHISNFSKNKMNKVFERLSGITDCLYDCEEIDENWKKDLE